MQDLRDRAAKAENQVSDMTTMNATVSTILNHLSPLIPRPVVV